MKALILGAGPAQIDPDATPLWLVENDGQLLIERFSNACQAIGAQMAFAVRAAEIKRWRIDNVIHLAAPGAAVVPITGETAGAACTALLCIQHIDPDAELLILNNNEYLDIDHAEPITRFRQGGFDAGVITFPSIHPRYSYVRLDDEGLITEAAEKNPISRHAIPGFLWFRHGSDFIEAAQNMIRKDANLDGRYFISLTLNEMVLRQKRMTTFPIEAKRYHPLKSGRQLQSFEREHLNE